MSDTVEKSLEQRPEQYSGKVTQVGNSKGVRLDAAFFKAHPEFSGEVQATVVADGQVLLSAKSSGRTRSRDEDADPVLLGFLRFLETQMSEHPDQIVAADVKQMRRIGKLIKGVEVE